MEIGIIGSGNIGSILARNLTKLGHQVSIANSRGPATLDKVAAETGATPVTVAEAAKAKDMVIITIPEKAIPKLPIDVLAKSSATIVDTGNYYPARDGQIQEIDNGLTESEWVAKNLKRSVVKAFNNIVAPSLATKGLPSGSPNRIALSVAGDDSRSKQVVLGLIDKLGFDVVDTGKLSDSWRQQPGTPAYCHDLNVADLKSALIQADSKQVGSYRFEANEQARPYF
jgi:predicted dinucleotide-binding enzyme